MMKSPARLGIRLAGTGSAVPSNYLDNQHLSQMIVTSDEWITTCTRICWRHLLGHGHWLTTLVNQAAERALAITSLAPQQLDLIILVTSTPDGLFGSANLVQARLGANQAVAFDLTATCTGFVCSLVTADLFIFTGVYRNVLVIGADVLSRWVNWSARRTCVLFGDAVGKVALQAIERDYLLKFQLHTDGSQSYHLNLSYQVQVRILVDPISVSQGTYQLLRMNSKDIYRFVVQRVPEAIEKALFQAGLMIEQINWLFLMHQAKQRLLEAVTEHLGLPSLKIVSNVAKYSNTSAASISLTLDKAIRSSQIQSHNVTTQVEA